MLLLTMALYDSDQCARKSADLKATLSELPVPAPNSLDRQPIRYSCECSD